eukprot:477636-Amphidinium_carterae.2
MNSLGSLDNIYRATWAALQCTKRTLQQEQLQMGRPSGFQGSKEEHLRDNLFLWLRRLDIRRWIGHHHTMAQAHVRLPLLPQLT